MTTRMTTTRFTASTTRALAPLLLVLVSSGAGCGKGTSPATSACPGIAATGGNPVGSWVVTDACQVPYAKTATPDWCSQLVYGGGTVKDGLFLGQPFAPIVTDSGIDPATGKFTASSWVKYTDDGCPNHDCGQYAARVTFAGQTTTNFPPGCLDMHTPTPTCSELQMQMQMLVDNNVLPLIQNISCVQASNGGCDCSYLVTNATIFGDQGTWRLSDGLIVHYPSPAQPPESVDYSVDGDTMELHGHAGIRLLTHDPLRTLSLVRGPAGFNPTP
jgi:hypothetical protein